ncbi:unnamed protein product [Ceratitis capitata]|nr:unnamed protein product [Ceratitis capitata]
MRFAQVFKPQYKRLTKEMFPQNAWEGLNIPKANKLLIYVNKKPEKRMCILLLLIKRLQEFVIRDEQE